MSDEKRSDPGAARASPPLDANAHGGRHASSLAQVGLLVKHGLPAFMFLLALTVLIEHSEQAPAVDALFARYVAEKSSLPLDDRVVEPRVTVVEISAPLRLKQFEAMRAMSDSTAERMDGVRPTDRRQVAGYLRRIAALISDPELASELKVIGIDVDLAPLEDADTDGGEAQVRDAVNELRKVAPIVLVAFDRPTEDRHARNRFMRAMDCRADEAAERPDGSHALYFASPALFTARDEAPLRFPHERRRDGGGGEASAGDGNASLPDVFPSLGALMHLVSSADDGARSNESLTLLCRQARRAAVSPDGDQSILQDELRVADRNPKAVAAVQRQYEKRMYNWRLLDKSSAGQITIDRLEQLVDGPNDDALQTRRLRSLGERMTAGPGLILAIASGGSNDRYYLPYAYRDWVDGATVHAMEMISRTEGFEIDEKWLGALAFDLLVGSIFIVVTAFSIPFLEPRVKSAPFLGSVLMTVLPLLVAWPLVLLSIRFCSYELDRCRWCNPCFVIGGLALHAYLEAHAGTAHSHRPASLVSALSFRIDRLRRTFRDHRARAAGGGRALAPLFDSLLTVSACWLAWLWALHIVFAEYPGAAPAVVAALLVTVACAVLALTKSSKSEHS